MRRVLSDRYRRRVRPETSVTFILRGTGIFLVLCSHIYNEKLQKQRSCNVDLKEASKLFFTTFSKHSYLSHLLENSFYMLTYIHIDPTPIHRHSNINTTDSIYIVILIKHNEPECYSILIQSNSLCAVKCHFTYPIPDYKIYYSAVEQITRGGLVSRNSGLNVARIQARQD